MMEPREKAAAMTWKRGLPGYHGLSIHNLPMRGRTPITLPKGAAMFCAVYLMCEMEFGVFTYVRPL